MSMPLPYEYQPSITDGDLLPVVDHHDNVIGHGTRREVHERALLHRAVHVVVIDGEGNVLLQKRSNSKDSHPGWWDISVGGHVDKGESYEEAVTRELREELGLGREATPREVGRRSPTAENGWEFVRVYECVHRGPFEFNEDEISEVRWAPAAELIDRASPEAIEESLRITRSGLESIRLWAQKRNN
jgi:16S rRNA (adenine1518-N6/adenine1519-N6)-dimethyltransferase